MAGHPETITYVFHLADGRQDEIALGFTDEHFLLAGTDSFPVQGWAALDFEKCGHCPLPADEHPLCPFAHALSGFLGRFDAYFSYETAVVEVITSQRTVVARRPLQDAMASLVGLIGATSGCPHLAFFRPMARFHLPFASEEETLVRAFSFYLLGQYLRSGGQGAANVTVEGILAPYKAVAEVNKGMADRLRAAFEKDAAVNAVVILDTFAQAVPWVVHKALDELRYIFGPGGTTKS